jgi:hypothetical protein
MVNRVTDCEIKSIIETDLATLPFAQSAHALVEDCDLAGKGLGESTLKLVELWLAAHFVAIRERQLQSEKMGDSADAYMGEVGKGLDATTYGQQAKVLDTTGALANLGKRRPVFEAL